jgi:REP element-mobilizing transposase RayT
MTFELFDRKAEYTVRRGALPHWYQPGVTYFVTYRTADSVPHSLLRAWHAQRDDWLRRHGLDPTAMTWKTRLRMEPDLERQYERTFTRQFMEYLDCGHGACPLARRHVAEIVADNLRHFDGRRYHLGDFIVMPNHVHVLVCLVGDTQIEAQCRSWKRYTAAHIHRALARRGRFWQEETFDHLVRTPEQFARFRHYIADNPRKARLGKEEYLHYVAEL